MSSDDKIIKTGWLKLEALLPDNPPTLSDLMAVYYAGAGLVCAQLALRTDSMTKMRYSNQSVARMKQCIKGW